MNKITYHKSYVKTKILSKNKYIICELTGGEAIYNLLKNINLEDTCDFEKFHINLSFLIKFLRIYKNIKITEQLIKKFKKISERAKYNLLDLK